MSHTSTTLSSRVHVERRRHPRLIGPFEAMRLGIIDTPLRLYDLSEGGCFVTALHSQPSSIEFELRIELPYEGPITVMGCPRYERPQFGYGVQFTQVDDIAADKLHRSLRRLETARKLTSA